MPRWGHVPDSLGDQLLELLRLQAETNPLQIVDAERRHRRLLADLRPAALPQHLLR